MVWQALQPKTTRNALEPFSASGAISSTLLFHTGLHFNQLLLYASTQHFWASRPSILSLKKTSIRHKHYFRLFLVLCKETTDVHTAVLRLMCLSHIFLPETIGGNYALFDYVSNSVLLAWNYRKHIAQTDGRLCVCYINLCSSISRVPKADISAASPEWAVFCSIRPISQPFRHRFLYYLLHFHNPSQS